MLVIPQQAHTGPLPQPAGPSAQATPVKTQPHEQLRLEQLKNVGGPSRGNTPDAGQAPPAKPLGRAGTFARAQTMLTPTSAGFSMQAQASGSSRSSSPLSSAPSSYRSSPRLRGAAAGASSTLTTPSSTMPSSVGSSAEMPQSKTGKSREPFVDIGAAPSKGKAKAKQPAIEDPAAIPYEVPDIAIPAFARMTKNAQRDLARVWEAVAGARRIAVVTGAGISVSSPANIPDFRSTAGLFRKLKEKHPNAGLSSGKDLFDANLFKSPSTSALFYSMVAELKAMADAAQPTSFHHLLKRLDLEGRLQRVYTQNIDGLEEKAGLTFGLGETADSRAALRALGKRKREIGHGPDLVRKGGMARSKSDSAVLLSRQSSSLHDEPMFPRSIPLHGSLSTMTCQICGHKVYLSLASSGQQTMPRITRELSPDAGDQATAAMDLLSQGEPVSCKQCEAHAEVRSVAGLRSRGVGLMKVDVVLYNGQNEGAERVGDCLERDILGLRDPNEASVPESHRERSARERKERKEQQASSSLQPIMEAASTDEAFASAFGEAENADDPFLSDFVKPEPAADVKPKRQQRLKPLPPDLLIVAGTSLKVPGTKRIVREFAKACQAQDQCIVEESSGEESEAENGATSKAKGKQRSRSSTPKAKGRKSKGSTEMADEERDDEEEDDINAPIRTILLNYDFPLPHASWDDVFDVWVQGDVQQAALGLWHASTYPSDNALNGFSMHSDADTQLVKDNLSWAPYLDMLEKERIAEKKAQRSKASGPRSQETLENAWQKAGTDKTTKPGVTTPKKKAAGREHISASPKKSATVAKTKKSGKAAAAKASESPAKKKTKAAAATTAAAKETKAGVAARPPKATALTKHVQSVKKASAAANAKAASAATAAAGGKMAKPAAKSKQAQTAA